MPARVNRTQLGLPPLDEPEPVEPEGSGEFPAFSTGWSPHVPIHQPLEPDPDPDPWGCDGFGTPWPEGD